MKEKGSVSTETLPFLYLGINNKVFDALRKVNVRGFLYFCNRNSKK